MSKSAWWSLLLTAVFGFMLATDVPTTALEQAALKIAIALSGAGFIVALLVGRRFKFDPVLR